ncbi:MAG TPA: matrixin family metalloprotease [Thermoanaerobaculia bacterium]|nr:matrixin family metalloprotease [Thermoanaerobaculia bacterium]
MARKYPDLNDLRLCVDRPVPDAATMDAAVIAMSENNENEPPPLVIRPGQAIHPVEIALFAGKKWANGRKVGVKFLDGTKKQKAKTQQHAEVWEQHANINFDFAAGAKAEIRISFKEKGSWSALGTDALITNAFPKTKPTMNYGWLKDDSDETEWRRVVLHEFGHALGAIHEHQNPAGGIKWNLKEVYRVFSGPPNNWTKQQIDFNIVQKYSIDQLNSTNFDKLSIMLYAFPGSLIVGGVGTQNNTDLSSTDKQFIAASFPKKTKKAAAPKLSARNAPIVAESLSLGGDAAPAEITITDPVRTVYGKTLKGIYKGLRTR